ncbi:DegT/DnrJ/EryC1/StrS aminotransferase [archaeon]|nr:DegT/DnrJ/EryC1/StrS aminotransferase [archaeon]
MANLAINGGEKFRKEPFPKHPIIGDEEKKAALDVLERGELSTFLASPGQYFLGGKKIKEFEDYCKNYFNVKHAILMNSATACLHASLPAIGVKEGEEVLVTPYSMSCSATCALMNNTVPIFVDVNEENFSIDPKKIEEKITEKTKAIIVVHLFGGPANMDEIMEIAKKHNLKVIEDCAQSPGGTYKDKLLGTIGDCGLFSFTETKNITAGEGGLLITNDDSIADVAQLIRNHGEAVIVDQPRTYSSTILGYNYRMTEIDAAIGLEQFKKLDSLNNQRIKLAEYLSEKIKQEVPGITPYLNNENGKNVYFILPFKYSESKVGIPRDKFIEALNAEGIPFGSGYVKPLYLSPIFHENKHFALKHFASHISYDKGICPTVEKLHEKEIILTLIARPPATLKDMDDIVEAMKKIIENKEEL